MKKQEISKLHRLSDLVGDFIRYWGFRKIHGEIWTTVYLSKNALSGTDIVDLLQVSKALVSPALKELEAEGLIFQVKSENSKTKRYAAQEDVAKIIRNILNRREKPMLDKIMKSYLAVSEIVIEKADAETGLDKIRLQKIGTMIQTAQAGLSMLADSEQLWS